MSNGGSRGRAGSRLRILLSVLTFLVTFSLTMIARERPSGRHRIVMANVHVMNKDPEPFVDFIQRTNPDVIIVQELNADWVGAINAKLRNRYPYSHAEPSTGYFGIGLWSRGPVHGCAVEYPGPEDMPILTATVSLGQEEIHIISTHVYPPTFAASERIRGWQMDAIRERIKPRTVVIGDFNTLPWFLNIEKTNLVGWAGTWEGVVPIDHALITDDLDPAGVWAGPDIGSDHRPLVLELN